MKINLRCLQIIFLVTVMISCNQIPRSQTSSSWAEKTLAGLSLREKISQMLIYHMNMSFLNEKDAKWKEISSLLESDGIGGIHIYYGEPGIARTTMNKMNSMSKVPLIFDGDIEYGMQFRYHAGTDVPPLMAIGATGDPHLAYDVGRITAIEATAGGIFWNLMPVLDVNNNPQNPIINTRSFGEDAEMVVAFGREYIRGLQDYGMAATAKHFPGHGDTGTDSHSRLAIIPSDSTRLWSLELKPFAAAIEVGVDAVMIAHVSAPDFQPNDRTPATLSPFWIQDILRKEMGFRGIVITDAMGMGGVAQNFSQRYALVETIKAGSDVIITTGNYRENIDIIEDAVNRGLITRERIDEASLRMLRLKEKLGLHRRENLVDDTIFQNLGDPEIAKIAANIAEKAITLIKRNPDAFPLTDDRPVYVIDLYGRPQAHSISTISQMIFNHFSDVKTYQIDESDSTNHTRFILTQIPDSATVVINAFVIPRAWKDEIYLNRVQSDFMKLVEQKKTRTILISFGNPYLIKQSPGIETYICAYKSDGLMQRAAFRALIGAAPISGKLPVTIPDVAALGDGISLPKVSDEIRREAPEKSPVLQRVLPYEVNAQTDNVLRLLNEAIADSAWPGAVLLAAKDGKIFLHAATGHKTYQRTETVHRGDIFDLASITKVIATTTAVMQLHEQGRIELDDPVVQYLPAFRSLGKGALDKSKVTIRQLLTHTSGLPPFRQYFLMEGTVQARVDSVLRTGLIYTPGDTMVYSDVGIISLGKVVEAVSGQSLDQYCADHIFIPLGMVNTMFNPDPARMHRIMPTEFSPLDGQLIRGHVHDENSYSMGGTTGHAGLFSTAYDIGIFSQMMLNGGEYQDTRILHPETIDLFIRRANVISGSSRCLGWDSPSGRASGGVYLSGNSFGHTGFTGTSLWIDPDNEMFVILLTNAVHPNRSWKSPKYYQWRQRIHSAVYESLGFTQPNPELEWIKQWE